MRLTLKKTVVIIAVVLAIPLIAALWWLLSPLFTDKTVIEEFPMSAGAEMPPGITRSEAESIMSGIAKIDMDTIEPIPKSMADAAVIATGQFRDADRFHKGSGTATIYRLADGSGVLRLESLNVTNGPDLHVLTTTNPNPAGRDELHRSGYIDLGPLKGNRGDQNYSFPADADIESFGSVVIYCMPFHVIFSVATLQ